MTQEEEYLLCKYEALNSNPIPTKKKKNSGIKEQEWRHDD
jgi:hypothetical protein